MSRGEIDRQRDALLVVDIQNDFCPGGALGVRQGDEVIPLVAALFRRFHHVILTQDWHPPGHISFASAHAGRKPFDTIALPYGPQTLWPDHCVQGTAGAAFHPHLTTAAARLIVRKGIHPEIDSYSTFFENDRCTPTGLAGALRELGATRVFLAGLATDYCVLYSALDARREGFAATVLLDACRAIDRDGSLARARQAMAEAGVVATTSDAIV